MADKPQLLAPGHSTRLVGHGRWRERLMPAGTRMFICP
jgi:hypothetical protein